jgi:hypothetical protein
VSDEYERLLHALEAERLRPVPRALKQAPSALSRYLLLAEAAEAAGPDLTVADLEAK